MLQSIIVYTLTALSLFLLGKSVVYREQNKIKIEEGVSPFFCWEIVLSILIFAVISGIRYDVGADYEMYLSLYEDYRVNGVLHRDTLEPGFVFITRLFGKMNLHFSVFFGFLAALQVVFIYYTFRNNIRLLPFVALCLVLGPYYLLMMTGVRQMIAACMFLFAVEFIDRKKFVPFLLILLLASLMHRTVLFLIPLYFILNCKFDFNRRKYNYIILLTFLLLGFFPIWTSLLKYMFDFFNLVGYGKYQSSLQSIINGDLSNLSWGPGRISLFIIDLIIIWYYNDIRDRYHESKNILRIYFILFFVGACFYQLLADTSNILLRPVAYFTMFKLPLTAYLLYYFMDTNKKIYFYIFLFLACSSIYISVFKAGFSIMPDDFVTYKFFWNCV